MIFVVPAGRYHPKIVMQRAGYTEFGQGRAAELSFVRRLGTHFYPRFHVYLTPTKETWKVTLHLDQKHASYQGIKKHSGEYDGDLVTQEAERLKYIFRT